ncbi:hypothetical protein B0H14DRAFT_2613744 [Mycena olivaceomarginata]|nr:hypothetical protein B0H14DRAFT_2613744 [Mycena olivaceomarginata]
MLHSKTGAGTAHTSTLASRILAAPRHPDTKDKARGKRQKKPTKRPVGVKELCGSSPLGLRKELLESRKDCCCCTCAESRKECTCAEGGEGFSCGLALLPAQPCCRGVRTALNLDMRYGYNVKQEMKRRDRQGREGGREKVENGWEVQRMWCMRTEKRRQERTQIGAGMYVRDADRLCRQASPRAATLLLELALGIGVQLHAVRCVVVHCRGKDGEREVQLAESILPMMAVSSSRPLRDMVAMTLIMRLRGLMCHFFSQSMGPKRTSCIGSMGTQGGATRRGVREHGGSPGEGGGQWEAWWQRARRAGCSERGEAKSGAGGAVGREKVGGINTVGAGRLAGCSHHRRRQRKQAGTCQWHAKAGEDDLDGRRVWACRPQWSAEGNLQVETHLNSAGTRLG